MKLKPIFILLCLLTACVSTKPNLPNNTAIHPVPQISPLHALTSFELTGAIGVKSVTKTWAATLHWSQQDPRNYHIHLFGPISCGNIVIQNQNGHITYRDGVKTLTSTDADALFRHHTGIQLPVSELTDWVRGIPGPSPLSATTHNEKGQISSFVQSGYHVEYTDFTDVHQIPLPHKIQVQGHGLKIKLIIKHWSVPKF